MADTLKKGSRVTGSERDRLAADLRKRYDGGASIRTLADSTGRSYGFVHRILTESGATLRGRGGATRGKARQHAQHPEQSPQPQQQPL
ncbi:MAG: helix-turn-helix domain-containing protein [Trebonia sp.]